MDIVNVKKDSLSLGRERARRLRKLIRKKVAADFLVYRPEELDKRLKMEDPFLESIMKEGKILYGN